MSRMNGHTQFVYPPGWNHQPTPREVLANSPDIYNASSLSRMNFTRVMDPRRNIEDECGYPRYGDRIDVELYKQFYDRDPIANRCIQCLPKESWQVTPKVYEDEGEEPTEFEQAWDDLELGLSGGGTWFSGEEGSSIWSYLLRADILSGIGSFGVLLLGLDDGMPLHTPAAGALVTNSSVPGDSPLTADEEKALLKPATRRVWTGRTNPDTKRRIVRNVTAPDLNPLEKAVLDEWKHERERVLNGRDDRERMARWEYVGDCPKCGSMNHDGKKCNSCEADLTEYVANCATGQTRDPDTGRCGHGVGLGVSRDEMPQIRGEDVGRFLTYARSQGVGVAEESASAEDLSPVQREFKQDRIDAIPDDNDEPLITDAEDRILDGTHRWMKWRQAGRGIVNVIRIDLLTKDALALMRRFGGTTYAENADDRPRQSGRVSEPKGRPTGTGSTGDGKTAGDLTGTDLQYSWQMSPPQSLGGDYPANPNGTDEQYYGVQFGPSEQPSEDTAPKSQKRKLLFLRPFDESLVQIVRYEWNLLNPRFGMPVMYRVTLNDPRETHSGIGLPMATVFVHWSRVIHITDGNGVAGSSEIFSAPRLRPVLDRVYDLRKVYGAAGEAYWKAAFHIMQFSTHAQLGGDVEVNVGALRDQVEQVDNGLQRWLLGRGGMWSAIAPTATDPTPFVTMAMEALCIQMGIPVRVFKGSERGELASSQDDSAWNDRLRHRQAMYLTPRVCVPFIDRLIQLGVLPEPKTKPDSQGGTTTSQGGDKNTPGGKDVSVAPMRGGVAAPPGASKDATSLTVPPPKENRFYPYAPRTYGRVEVRYHNRVLVRNAFGKVEEKDAKDVAPDDTPLTPPKETTEKVVKADAPAGYHLEWPDLDSLSDKDKAAIFLQRTQAWAAYVSGGLENAIPVETFASKFDQMTEEEAASMVADTTAAHAAEDTMTTPPMIAGRPAAAPPGTQDHADQQQAKAQADAELKVKQTAAEKGVMARPPSVKGGPPKPNGKPPAPAVK